MHCGLPWWREFGGRESNIEDPPRYIRYATIHIFSNTLFQHTRGGTRVTQESKQRTGVTCVRNAIYLAAFDFARCLPATTYTRCPISRLWKRDNTRAHICARARTGWRNLAPILMIIGAPRFAGSGQITPSKKGEILVPLFGSNVARWMCIWINFLFDNGLMKRLNRRSAGLSRLVSLNEKGKG